VAGICTNEWLCIEKKPFCKCQITADYVGKIRSGSSVADSHANWTGGRCEIPPVEWNIVQTQVINFRKLQLLPEMWWLLY